MTAKRERIVLDTNVFISGIVFRSSTPWRAIVRAFEEGEVLCSSSTRNELREVVSRPKFERYMSLTERMRAVEDLIEDMEPFDFAEELRVCADPKDDKFLELAIHGNADIILSGDDHLLRLHPFRGIRIMTPAEYLGDTAS